MQLQLRFYGIETNLFSTQFYTEFLAGFILLLFEIMKKKINRPSLNKIVCIGIVILLSACSSHKRINKEASKIRCNKTVHFIFDEASNFAKIEYFGKETIGDSPYPNYKNTFKNSIIELNKITNAEIEFKQKLGLPTKSVMQVIMKIEKIVWVISRSSAVMTADLSFYVDGEKIGVIGENKVHWAGTKKGNLYKCLKNGTFNFLNIICSK